MSDREDLHRNWMTWVTTNLGRDARLAQVAVSAATDEVELGRGFNDAADAARIAWAKAAALRDDSKEPREVLPRRANHPRSLFYASVAVVLGFVVYPVVFGAVMPRIGLLAPLLVTLVAGFLVGLFSRSWRLALLCSWFVALLGLFGALLDLVPLFGGVELDLHLALLFGGLGGAGVGGYLGAKLRGD